VGHRSFGASRRATRSPAADQTAAPASIPLVGLIAGKRKPRARETRQAAAPTPGRVPSQILEALYCEETELDATMITALEVPRRRVRPRRRRIASETAREVAQSMVDEQIGRLKVQIAESEERAARRHALAQFLHEDRERRAREAELQRLLLRDLLAADAKPHARPTRLVSARPVRSSRDRCTGGRPRRPPVRSRRAVGSRSDDPPGGEPEPAGDLARQATLSTRALA
jgi:hypothetical protein